MTARVDASFDVRSDTPVGRDPDTYSRTLGRYHELLWSKPTPNGSRLELAASRPPVYLHHQSGPSEFWLASDSVIHTYTSWASMRAIVEQIPEADNEAFRSITSTIGAMMVWPANRISGAQTINGARGFTLRISDRFDLTLECVRRYYLGTNSPLRTVFDRYPEFFALFVDFHGFVDFFLLQDMVTADYASVAFMMPFDDFKVPPVPRDLPTYLAYRDHSIKFVRARNSRISRLEVAAESHSPR